jgi:two-component system sensor histidine kinase BarA
MKYVTDRPSAGQEFRLRILVVDDDVLSLHLMQVLLTQEGYQVAVASTGLEALATLKHQQFDAVLIDLQMPGMDGLETSRRIRALEKDSRRTFVVALTASYLPDGDQTLFESGLDGYLPKPFEVAQIELMLKHHAETSFLRSAQESPARKAFDA